MKRRLTALALALGLTLTLAACGGGTTGTADSPAPNTGDPAPASSAPAAEESDVAYIKEKGTLVVGITEFAPMDYQDENGEWIGFDADMARRPPSRQARTWGRQERR